MRVVRRERNELVLSTTGGERAPGVHLSDLVRLEMVRREKRFNTSDPMDMMRVDAGHTWEEIVAHALQRREEKGGPKAGYRPDAICFDGIWCSPDWLNPGGQFPLEEWKATKTSSKKGWDAAHWYWELQVLGYAHALTELGILEVNSALVRVWYINGDYDWSAKVDDLTILRDYVEFELHFTARDKQDNWNKLKALGQVHGLLKKEPKFEAAGIASDGATGDGSNPGDNSSTKRGIAAGRGDTTGIAETSTGDEWPKSVTEEGERTPRRKSSRPPQPSPAKLGRLVTFPSSRSRSKKSDA